MTSIESPLAAIGAFKAMFPRLYKLARAIQEFEGYDVGTRAFRNCNPGNLRSSVFATGADGGYAKFDNYFQGFLALLFDLWIKCDGRSSTKLNPNSSLKQLIEVWAPAADDNNPEAYVTFVAQRTYASTTTRIAWFLEG